MIIGAAGGHEILTSLYYDAANIDAIELNPVTHDLVTGRYADYTGHLADQPGVNYVLDDGRSYLERADGDYDLVWFPAPDSYAAANAASSGAFVLSESYLYTKQTVKDSLDHLRPDGILAAQFGEVDYTNKPNRTARYASTVREALGEKGIDDAASHMMVITTPSDLPPATISTILVKKTPFTPADVARITDQMGAVEGSELRHAPGRPSDGGVVDQIITLPDDQLDDFYSSYRFDVRPDLRRRALLLALRPLRRRAPRLRPEDRQPRPRVGHGRAGDAAPARDRDLLRPRVPAGAVRVHPQDVVGAAPEGVVGALLRVPRLRVHVLRDHADPEAHAVPRVPDVLADRHARVDPRVHRRRCAAERPAVAADLAGRAAVARCDGGCSRALYLFGLPAITDSLFQLPLAGRIVLAFLLLAPLGRVPRHVHAARPHRGLPAHHPLREYVAWGWAVNGFASVVGSVLTTLLAMTFGFAVVLLFGLAAYVVAILALRGLLGAKPALSGT